MDNVANGREGSKAGIGCPKINISTLGYVLTAARADVGEWERRFDEGNVIAFWVER